MTGTLNCQTSAYAVYYDGPFDSEFRKLYKGVIVNASTTDVYGHFAIRKHSIRIFGRMFPRKWVMLKNSREKMDQLKFRDSTRSVEIVADKENPSPNELVFDKNTYLELKKNIPDFLESVGFRFEVWSGDGLTELSFFENA